MGYEDAFQRIEKAARYEAIELDIMGNQLTALPPEIGELTSLTTLDLRDNPLPIPPKILAKTDEPATIINYYLQREADQKKPSIKARLSSTTQPDNMCAPAIREVIMGEKKITILSKVVEDELNNLDIGRILFNPPQEMKVGVKDRVEVRIAKTIAEDFIKGLRGRGIPQIEKIKVGTFMKVRLVGDNFDIKSLSHDEQAVEGEDFTQWEWDVTPLTSGIQSLLLSVTVRIKIFNDGEETKDYPVFERRIKVKVNLIHSTKKFIEKYWKWIATTIISSGIIGWVVKGQG